jgi:hypothetical protein
MLVNRRRPAPLLDPNGKLHWATAFIAREHRRTDIEEYREWLCPCWSCNQVRSEILRMQPLDEHNRLLAAGGAQ